MPSATLALLLALASPTLAAFTSSNLAVSRAAHAGGGGCYPAGLHTGPVDQLMTIDPEWAAIDTAGHTPPDADPVTIHGTVRLAKINEGGDFPGNHVTDDQNTFIDVDPTDMHFVATGNVGLHGEEEGQLEVEWEIGSYPLFAWPGAGNRLVGIGRWIWDCGHADPDPVGSCSVTTSQDCVVDADCAGAACPGCIARETCTGVVFNYHSELHPPEAVAVTRLGQGWAYTRRPHGGRLATRADIWISPDGGGASDRCIVRHHPNPADLLTDANCFPLTQPLADVNARNFIFELPLPPRPSPDATPRVRIFNQTPRGLPRPDVIWSPVAGPDPRVRVFVPMTVPVRGRLPRRVGVSVIAGWRPEHRPTTRLVVRVTGIDILDPLKPATPVMSERHVCAATGHDCRTMPCPAGETCLAFGGPIPGWEVFLEVNGVWQELGGLASISTPTSVPQQLVYDLALPPDGTLRLHASGHSLDCRETLYGNALSHIFTLLGFVDGPACLQVESRDVGDFELTFPGPDFGVGSYVTASGSGAFQLHYTVASSR